MLARQEMLTHNLPLQLTRFIGREREIEAIKRLLVGEISTGLHSVYQLPSGDRTRARLVTLTGVGGCGKTRLAIEVATTLCRDASEANPYISGVRFVEFAPLSNPARVAQVVASAFNLHESPDLTSIEILVQALHPKHLLLLFDNCEHLTEACAQLARTLLQACPGVAILTTSRTPLNLPGEIIFPVPSLEILNPNDQLPITNLVQCEAVRLFVDRALAVQPHFTLTEPQARAVIQICQQLDGIPLAIELAASRIKMLTPQQIVRRLDDTFHLLRNIGPTVIGRHQNLHAAFDWSYALLTEPERVLFRRLSVFAGGWTLGAAEATAGFMPLTPPEVFDLHQRLLDQSLVTRVDDGQDERARYRMLEPLRQYAAEKLAETTEGGQARDRHLEYFMRLAEEAWYGFISAERMSWFNRIEAEIDNIRTALDWSMGGGNLELGLKLATALFHFWLERNYVLESIEVFQNLLAHPKAALTLVRAKTLAILSLSHLRLGDFQQAILTANESLAIEQELPDPQIKAYALAGLGHAYALQGKYAEALFLLEQSLTLFQGLEYITGQGWALSRLGTVALMISGYKRAESWLGELENLMQDSGNMLYLPYALRYGGYALFHQGDYAGAIAKFRKLLISWEPEEVNPASVAACAMVAIANGQSEQGAQLLSAMESMLKAEHIILLPYDNEQFTRSVALVRAQFHKAAVKAAWEKGRSLTMEQAIAAALMLCDSLQLSTQAPAYPAGLTQREVEVLQLVAEGLTNQQIADRLVISHRTVHAHLRSVFGKVEVTTRTAAVLEANRLKLF